jgi:hypothetical protein
MASTYLRKDSPFIWISYKSVSGVWKNTNTGYRQDNIGDRKQAEKLAKRKTLEEMANKPKISSDRGTSRERQGRPCSRRMASMARQKRPVY